MNEIFAALESFFQKIYDFIASILKIIEGNGEENSEEGATE